MPGDVNEFLQHVHAEKAKKSKNARDQPLQSDDGDDEQLYYYETANELNVLLSQADQQHPWERRHKRMYKDNYLFNYIIDLPIGEHSSNWFLVTNDNIGMWFGSFIWRSNCFFLSLSLSFIHTDQA